MQEGRLFQILYYLLEHGQGTAAQLAERLEVSVRTIYRDLDALSGAGVPVYTEQGRGGGIHLLDGFVLENAVLSAQEKQEILAALQSLSALWQQADSPVLQKLSALFAAETEPWLEVDFSRWGSAAQEQEKFSVIKWAVLHHQLLEITYVGSNGQRGIRRVEPLKLLYKGSAWYLQAYCREKEDFRLFKISRILGYTLLEETFAVRAAPATETPPPANLQPVVLHFTAAVAYRVYDEFAPEQITVLEDGSLLAAAELPFDSWLVGYVLSFGVELEVLEPQLLRQEAARQARKICEQYQS